MNEARWTQISRLFATALDYTGSDRSSWLSRECAGDEALCAEVEALLVSDAVNDGFLEPPTQANVKSLAVTEPPNAIGMRVGPYRLERRIGQGGMGAVYEARRVDGQFEQRVAIKLIRADLAGPEAARRFEQERRVLAMLAHPSIARLYDGGVAPDGRPYLVMEFIEGQPIDVFVQEHNLSLTARLDLIRRVCDAVHHAHQNLIVHRDLKPSNILVAADGTPKLIDFGIAKLLEDAPPSQSTATRGAAPLTPEYASPEQIRGEPITIATDVYALGVVLYETLTGRRAFAFASRRPRDIERAICESTPERPSTAVRLGARAAPAAAGSSEVRPICAARRLERLLAGELDNIVLMALRKEPARRYASAAALADDLRRYQRGQTVAAHPESLGYRLRTFVRRNRTVVSAAGLIGCVLAASTATSARFAWLEQQQRNLAERRQVRAETEAGRARAVADFLINMLTAIEPANARDMDTELLRLVLFEAEGALDAIDQEPLVAAEIRQAIGNTYRTIGDLARAEPFLQTARAFYATTLGPNDPLTLQATGYLGALFRDQGRYDEAAPRLRRVLDAARQREGSASDAALSAEEHLALLHRLCGRFAEAEALYRHIAGAREAADGSRDPDTLRAKHNLAVLLRYADRLPEAQALHEQVLAARRDIFGDDHPATLRSMNSLAVVYRHQRRLDEAAALYAEVVAHQQAVLGPDHPETLQTRLNLAVLYRHMRDYDRAEALNRDIISALAARRGDAHPDTIKAMSNLAVLLITQERYDEAEGWLMRVAAAREAVLGAEHPDTLRTLEHIAYVQEQRGETKQAEELYRQALARFEHAQGPHDAGALRIRNRLGVLLKRQGRFDEAREQYEATIAGRTARYGPDHRSTLLSRYNLAALCLAQGDLDAAEATITTVLAACERQFGLDDADTIDARKLLDRIHDHASAMEKDDLPGARPGEGDH